MRPPSFLKSNNVNKSMYKAFIQCSKLQCYLIHIHNLSVRLGYSFQFIFLFDRITVRGSFSGIDQLIGQAFWKKNRYMHNADKFAKTVEVQFWYNQIFGKWYFIIFRDLGDKNCTIHHDYLDSGALITCNRLDVSEWSFPSSGATKPDCLINSSKRGNINGLTSNSSCTSNPCRILTWSAIDDSIYQDL